MAVELNCPVCGAKAPSRLQHAKLIVCEHCQTSLFLEDEVVKHIGEKSVLTDVPSIIEMGRRFQYRNWTFEPYGRIRFDYGDGFWDEWWVVLDNGNGRWVSVDEGEIAIESPVEFNETPPDYDTLTIGSEITLTSQSLRVTERNVATCIGVQGELPEVIAPGETHQYVHLSGPRGLLLTLEFHDDSFSLYKGLWIDPFDLRVL